MNTVRIDFSASHHSSHLPSSFHTEAHYAASRLELDRRWRSKAFGKCIASEHSETQLLHIWPFIYYPHFTQTLTTLDFIHNFIWEEGARHIANALQMNTVRLEFSTSDHSPTSFIPYRHSLRCISKGTSSTLKERCIWQMHWKWTQWDSITPHLTTHLLASFHTDTHYAANST